MAGELKPFTKLQTLEIMIVETKNELTKSEIMEKIAFRNSLKTNKQQNEQMMGMQQAKIRSFKSALVELEAMHKEELEKEPKKEDN